LSRQATQLILLRRYSFLVLLLFLGPDFDLFLGPALEALFLAPLVVLPLVARTGSSAAAATSSTTSSATGSSACSETVSAATASGSSYLPVFARFEGLFLGALLLRPLTSLDVLAFIAPLVGDRMRSRLSPRSCSTNSFFVFSSLAFLSSLSSEFLRFLAISALLSFRSFAS